MRVGSFVVNPVAIGVAVALIMAALGVNAAWTAEEIGNVNLVKVWAYGTPPQTSREPLYRADDVYVDEVVETVENGALHIRFLDSTVTWAGPGTLAWSATGRLGLRPADAASPWSFPIGSP